MKDTNYFLILEHKHENLLLPDIDVYERVELIHSIYDVMDELYDTFSNDGYWYHAWNRRENTISDVFDKFYLLVKMSLNPESLVDGVTPYKYGDKVDVMDKLNTQPTALAFLTWHYLRYQFGEAMHTCDDDVYFYSVLKKIEETGEM